jgi:hypothetical protein
MTMEDRIPLLQYAIWKRLDGKKHLQPARLLERLGSDTGMHPQDVRRALARLKESGWLDGVALNGEPLGQLVVLATKPAAQEPASLTSWAAALKHCDFSEEERNCLSVMHTLLAGFEQDDLIGLGNGMLRLRDGLQTHSSDPQFVVSARYLLGSSKLIGAIPATIMRRFVGCDPVWPDQIPYVLTAGPEKPESVILIENPWAFEHAIKIGLAAKHALMVTFGYGLSRNGEAFGRQLVQQIEMSKDELIQLRRQGNTPEIAELFSHPKLTFWGDLDPEGLRIYSRLKRRLPMICLSSLYEPMRLQLLSSRGHPYHMLTGKSGQVPITAAELAQNPEITSLAEICELRGLDQEALSVDDILAYT